MVYSLVGSAKLIGLDPMHHLRHVFTRTPASPNTRSIVSKRLLPWNVAADMAAEQHKIAA
jgi:hypothetical protein